MHVLLAEVREELNWDKAHDTYGELQRCIVRGDQLELYGDVPRLLPDHLRPQVLEKQMEIEEYVREPTRRKKASITADDGEQTVAGKKRKRNDDIDRNIPPGASRGFVSVADLLVKGKKKKKVKSKEFNDALADDDSTDMELEGNLLDFRRTVSTPAQSSSSHKTSLPKSHTMVSKKHKSSTTRKKGPSSNPPSLQVDIDMEMNQDACCAEEAPTSKITHRLSPATTARSSGTNIKRSPKPICDDVIEITSSSPSRSTSPLQLSAPAVILTDTISSSKPKGKGRSFDLNFTPPPTLDSVPESANDQDIAWLLDGDEDPEIQIIDSSPAVSKTKDTMPRSLHFMDESVVEVDDSMIEEVKAIPMSTRQTVESPLRDRPAATPPRVTRASPDPTPDIPEGSFAVRPARRRRIVGTEIPDLQSPPRLCRLRRNDTEIISGQSTPPLQPKRIGRGPPISIRHNPLLDGEAAHSGDEESAGSSHSEDDVESESDRQFLKDIPDTQVSPSYDQSLVYHQSLFTQAPGHGPVFANRPVRGGFVAARDHSRRRPMVSSSPPHEDSEPDEYVYGSFVVADDADLSFE